MLRFTLEPGANLHWVNVLAAIKGVQTVTKFLIEPRKLDGAQVT